jgi:hypothetical protein
MNTQLGKMEISILREDMPLLEADVAAFNETMTHFPLLDRELAAEVEKIFKDNMKKKYGDRIQRALGNK